MRTVAAALCLLFVASSVSIAQNRRLDFELLNETGLVIMEVYVSPTDSREWGEDIMGRDVLGDGETVEIQFSRRETACEWDLRIIDEDEDEVVWTALDLCTAEHVTLQYENGRPTARIRH